VSQAAVVVVEDEEECRSSSLQPPPGRIREHRCGSLSDARIAIATQQPVVIVLDRMLPDGDGSSSARRCARIEARDVGVLVSPRRGQKTIASSASKPAPTTTS